MNKVKKKSDLKDYHNKITDDNSIIYQNNSFNVLSIADIHFGKKNDLTLNNELRDFIQFINECECRIDMVVILGDLYDRIIKMNELTSKIIIDFIHEICQLSDKYGFSFRIIKGTKTHDYNQLDIFRVLENEYNDVKVISTVTTEEFTNEDLSYKILYLPEEYPSNIYDYYQEYFNDTYDMIMGHGMCDFVAFTGNDDENTERFVKSAPVFKAEDLCNISNGPVLFGHIHTKKNYKNKIFYVGTYTRYSFAEPEDKGFMFTSYLSSTNEYYVEEYINDSAPKYYTCNIDDINFKTVEERVKYLNKLKKEYDFIKIKTSKESEGLSLVKDMVSMDDSLKLEVKSLTSEEDDKVDEQFLFILKRELDLPSTIQKYIEITKDKKLDLKFIKELIASE